LYVTNPCQVLLSFYYLVTNENLNHQYSLIGKYHLDWEIIRIYSDKFEYKNPFY